MTTINQPEARFEAVWLGDIVRVGSGRIEWTVTRASRRDVDLRSTKGVERCVARERVRLLRRCADGPQLEYWPDGRAYFGERLMFASDSCADVVTWWREEHGGRSTPQGVSMQVCEAGPLDDGHRLLEVNAFGYWHGAGLLRRQEVIELANRLLRISTHL